MPSSVIPLLYCSIIEMLPYPHTQNGIVSATPFSASAESTTDIPFFKVSLKIIQQLPCHFVCRGLLGFCRFSNSPSRKLRHDTCDFPAQIAGLTDIATTRPSPLKSKYAQRLTLIGDHFLQALRRFFCKFVCHGIYARDTM